MYSEIPPLFMYTNEPVKLILKSHSTPRFMRSLTINFLLLFCGPGFRRARILVSDRLMFTFERGSQ